MPLCLHSRAVVLIRFGNNFTTGYNSWSVKVQGLDLDLTFFLTELQHDQWKHLSQNM